MAIQPGVNVTKANGYAVLAPLAGIDFTKAAGYAPLGPSPIQPGVNVTKAGAYAVLAPMHGENFTKTVVYSLLFTRPLTLKVLMRGVKRVPVCFPEDLEQGPASKPVKRAI